MKTAEDIGYQITDDVDRMLGNVISVAGNGDDVAHVVTRSIESRDAEIHAMYKDVVEALRSAKASIELFEKVLLPKAESWMIENGQYKNHPTVENAMPLKFGEPTHYANTLRQIDKALAAIKEVKG